MRLAEMARLSLNPPASFCSLVLEKELRTACSGSHPYLFSRVELVAHWSGRGFATPTNLFRSCMD
jgi:hypothetical protein